MAKAPTLSTLIADDPFAGIRLKLSRAADQIKAFNTDVKIWGDDKPYRPDYKFDRSTDVITIFVDVVAAPKPEWGVIIGEIIHDLRSALDHVVWELVILTTGRPPGLPSKNQFPIFKSKEGFRDRGVNPQLACVKQEAVDLIASEQPYDKGYGVINDPLWHLAELSNADKHRTLHLTGSLLTAFNCKFGPPKVKTALVQELEVFKSGPIQQSFVLRRFRVLGIRGWPYLTNEMRGNLQMAVAFDERTPVVGRAIVMQTLVEIYQRVYMVLSRIAKEIFGVALIKDGLPPWMKGHTPELPK